MPDKAPPERELPGLSKEDYSRYSRHLLLPEVGLEGQRKLKGARVLIVGTGGLGAPLALYLAAAGVGTLGLADFDLVEASNLQRQIVHGTKDIDRPKVASARDRLRDLNPEVQVIPHNIRLSSKNALKIIGDYDLVADGTDNYPTRYLVGDACAFLGKPNVYASIYRFEGQASLFDPARGGPCYRCLYPSPPPPGLVPSCGEGGVMGVLPGIMGSIQAAEVIKLLVGGGRSLSGRLLLFDAWIMRFSEVKLEKDPECPVCGKSPTITELADYEEFCGLKEPKEEETPSLTALELKERLDRGESLQIIDIREPHERSVYPFPGSIYVPFGQLQRRMGEFDQGKETVVICKIGQRSLFAIRALKRAGYAGPLMNLRDGVNAWAAQVEGGGMAY